MKSTQFWGEYHVAGIYYEGRREVVSSLSSSEQVVFKREPQHPYDPNAIAIHTQDGRSVGYIPRDEARRIAPLMDQAITEDDTESRLSLSAKYILIELRKYVT